MSGRGRGKFQQKLYWNGARESNKTNSRERLDNVNENNDQNCGTYDENSEMITRSSKRVEQQYYSTRKQELPEKNFCDDQYNQKYRNDYRQEENTSKNGWEQQSFRNKQRNNSNNASNNFNMQKRSTRQSSEPRNCENILYKVNKNDKSDRQRDTKSVESNFRGRTGGGNNRRNNVQNKGRPFLPINIDALPPRLKKKFLQDNGFDINFLNDISQSSSYTTEGKYSSSSPYTGIFIHNLHITLQIIIIRSIQYYF